MNKNQSGLPSFITGYYGPGTSSSRAFQMFVKSIGESRSRLEEDRIVRRELSVLKEKLKESNISAKQMREYLVRLIYCEMLGHDASFGHIHAVNFAQQPNLLNKRVGYLALCLFLHENHPLIVLLVNTLRRDLQSSNVMDICCALTVVCRLISEEMMPALLPLVLGHLQSKRDIVRKKAVMALHKLYQKNPASIVDIKDRAKKALCDRDHGVMGASLNVYHDLISKDPSSCKEMVATFVSIQKQIIEGKLPRDFDYHSVPAPWLQIKLLRIMGMLGVDDLHNSQKMYEVLGQSLFTLNTSSLIGYAVAYECTRTITSIYPNKKLVEKAAKCVGMFLVNKNKDIKYLGLNTLAALVQVNSNFATQPAYQRIVIDCLDDPDETLKRKTLDLLCRITNATNVETVSSKLIGYLRGTVDSYFRAELVARVTELAERYAPDNSWYIDTMNEVFELGGQFVRPEVAHNLMRLLAEGNDDEEADNDLRAYAVSLYLDLLEKPVLPDILVHLVCWVVGEYSYTAQDYHPDVFLEKLCALLNRTYEDPGTKGWITNAISKLLAQIGRVPEDVKNVIDNQSSVIDIDMIQRCGEIRQLTEDIPLMQKVLPVDSSCEDLETDSTLSFLDEFVSQALRDGAQPYIPKSQRQARHSDAILEPKQPTLKITPYKTPTRRPNANQQTQPENPELVSKPNTTRTWQNAFEDGNKPSLPSKEESPSSVSATKILHSGKRVWGPGGLMKGRGRSGSMDSSKSGSSSKSSEPERIPVKSPARVTSAPLVMQSEEDYRKRQLAKALFHGVGDKALLQLKSGGRAITMRKVNSRTTGATRNGTVDSANVKGARDVSTQPIVDLLIGLDPCDTQDKPGTGGIPSEAQQVMSGAHLDSAQLQNEALPMEMTPLLLRTSGCTDSLQGDVTAAGLVKEEQTASILDSDIAEEMQKIEISEAAVLSLPKELSEFPHTPDLVELCSDSNVRITLRKVWKPTELVLVLVFTNQSQNSSRISQLCCVLQPPSNLKASCESATENKICIESIEPLQSEQWIISIHYLSPALHMSLSAKISYKDYNKTTKNLFIDHYTIYMSDLLRPLDINTEEFENKWKEAHFEKRQKIESSGIKNAKDLAERAGSLLNLHPVEIIGTKVIASGTIQQNGICLLHAKVEDGSLELRVKSASQLLSDAVMRQCGNVFR